MGLTSHATVVCANMIEMSPKKQMKTQPSTVDDVMSISYEFPHIASIKLTSIKRTYIILYQTYLY